jgi:phage major head subunit gpT-like protein
VFNNTITGLIDDTSADVIYDNYPFFDTAHPDKVGATYSNHTASRALNHDNLETTWETYTATNNRDERGNEIEMMPNVLLIPAQLKFTADRILKSTNIPESADNDINALHGLVTPMVWQRLSDTDGWFLGVLKRGLMATDRMAPELDFYQDETSKDYYATIIYRFGGCVTNWRFWYACNVSAT